MRRYASVVAAFILIALLAAWVAAHKRNLSPGILHTVPGEIFPGRTCSRLPVFLKNLHVSHPVVIDLSQKRYKGIALLSGKNFTSVLHPKQWEQYEHFSTYTLDEYGNIYLIPTPFISVHPTTFNLQKKIYKLDTRSGKISIFMEFEDVRPSAGNPYGFNAVAYDCDDHTLWVAAIDESDYRMQRGMIYHIDPVTKKILQRIEGFDALTLRIVHAQNGKYLLAGSARNNGLYSFAMTRDGLARKPEQLLEIPDPNEHIRKIKILAKNKLLLETIPFSYSLIARAAKNDRKHYEATWLSEYQRWRVVRRGER